MSCRIADLRYKEIINVCNGHRLGYVCDVEIDMATGQILSLIVPGPCRFLGLFWREDDYILPWDCIQRIGEDIIIIEVPGEHQRGRREKRSFF
jgi:YlmC/YmxH family sporulation protein